MILLALLASGLIKGSASRFGGQARGGQGAYGSHANENQEGGQLALILDIDGNEWRNNASNPHARVGKAGAPRPQLSREYLRGIPATKRICY